ncbi:MAG: glutathione S-transferase family protein [Myxococcales bacterium]|nr:glutathione S-transferase family protein [Myxococcales bacterium]MCB9714591.1 glutathione S-transferase family protein [Myxococcales bacterium]
MTVTLSYFDFPGGRGEDCRLALFLAGIDFVDDRVQGPQWPERKGDTPFGAMPVLEVEGKGKLGQSNAILAYVGREHGMHPRDPWEAARHEALMAAAEDLRTRITHLFTVKDAEQSKAAREELAAGYMQRWAADVAKQIAGPFVGGDQLQVVDLKLYVLMKWFVRGGVDHIPTDVFAGQPRLVALYEAVGAHPKVAEWNARFAEGG